MHWQVRSDGYRYGFQGMEKDDEVKCEGNSYTTEFRQYDPRVGRWLSLDPLMSKYAGMSPYVTFNNNPIFFVDPLGLEGEGVETDFINIDTGELYHHEDGKDQVMTVSCKAFNEIKSMLTCNETDQLVSMLEGTDHDLDLTFDEFMFLSETIYAESAGGVQESRGIVNVLENRAENQKTNLLDQLSDATPYGVYGVQKTSNGSKNDYEYAYQNEKGYGVEQKKKNIHKGIALALINDKDITNGAYFWDGTDITTNSHYTSWGLEFSDSTHNIWDINATSGSSQLITTKVHGKTTFSKFKNQGEKWYISE